MPDEFSSDAKFAIGHVLFIDIVGYSKLLIEEQTRSLRKLTETVQGTDQFRRASGEGTLLRLPTGDGMALVFHDSPESPARCAVEIHRSLQKAEDHLPVRMGIHSGPVEEVKDVSDRLNIAGAGINIAHRVMDCGDAGHILMSRHVAEDLESHARWRAHLHDLGPCEVKHGVQLGIVNVYSKEFGNPQLPEKIRRAREEHSKKLERERASERTHRKYALIAALLVLAAFAIGSAILYQRGQRLWAEASAATPNKSIAVLPFANLSNDKQNAYFADGVQDEILTALAKIANLKVISRTSVMQYKSNVARNLRKIGEDLGVSHLLEGSVQQANGRVRVNAQLIDARNDLNLWAQTYDRDLTDVFAIQSDIAKTIAQQLRVKLSPNEKAAIEKAPTSDLSAYDLYVHAKALFADVTDPVAAKEKMPQATALLDQAVARDAQFVLAWCLLSKIHARIYSAGFDHTPKRLEQARDALDAALRADPEAGEVHLAFANYYYQSFRDYRRARTELAIAQGKLPNNAELFEYTGYIERREGDWEQATRSLERSVDLDPRNFHTLHQLALTYQAQRRYQDQAQMYSRALAVTPGDPLTRILQSLVTADWKADLRPFQTTLAALMAEDPRAAADVDDINYDLCERTPSATARGLQHFPRGGAVNNGVNYPHAYWEGVVAFCQRDMAGAGAAFSSARDEVVNTTKDKGEFAGGLSLLGLIDAGLGRKEEAIREGRRACELLPISKDAIDGVGIAVNLAQIYAWCGEKDAAVAQIATVEHVPNYLTYGLLKLHPIWDSLRGDERFEQLLDSLAPKD